MVRSVHASLGGRIVRIPGFRHHNCNNCGTTHPSMAASKENKLPPSFSGFKSQKFLHESSYDGVSGTDNDEQSLKNLEKCLSGQSVLLISKRQYTSCKRRDLIIESEFKTTYFFWLLYAKLSLKGCWAYKFKSIFAHFQVLSWMILKALVLKKFELTTPEYTITYHNVLCLLPQNFA